MLSPAIIEAAREYHKQRDSKRLVQRENERQTWLFATRNAILALAPHFSAIARVYLFGSIVQSGRFHPDSDIDIAVECADLTQEGEFWRALEGTLHRDVDIRPYEGPILWAVNSYGERVYERQSATSTQHNQARYGSN